jgi:class 3 adenylate cyclase
MQAALSGIDTTAFSIVWRDVLPDTPDASLIYASPALNIDSLLDPDPVFTFVRSVSFAQRMWQFQVVYNLPTNWRLSATAAWFLFILFVIAVAVSVTTVIFMKNRVKLRQQENTTQLLRLVVPDLVSKQLASHVKLTTSGDVVLEGDTLIAHGHRQVALCFIDICNFTILSSTMTAQGLVLFLDEFFTLLDNELNKYKTIVKIKTIGDSYLAVAGLHTTATDVDEAHNVGGQACMCRLIVNKNVIWFCFFFFDIDTRLGAIESASRHGLLLCRATNRQRATISGRKTQTKKHSMTCWVDEQNQYLVAVVRCDVMCVRWQVAARHRRQSSLLMSSSFAAGNMLATSPETHDVERARCQVSFRF